ncbi:metal-dependent transcriptional regulator [Candidatus Bathyarchaeota archaeon]|nr:MAG: metal-dependent transcriptional regulator [Candidatus Bathyarchaeota archaeon]
MWLYFGLWLVVYVCVRFRYREEESFRKIFRLDLTFFLSVNVILSVEPRVTVNEGKYLKLIYRKQQEESSKVGTTLIAKTVRVRPATVTEMLQKLAEKRLLRYKRYYGVELTEEGIAEAKKLLRKHRLLETLFVNALCYKVQKACEEASKLDHYASEDLANTICQSYGHPDTCPCNKTIFSGEGCKGKS